jgi:SNF2 family DNA or RNA helicase
MKLYPYQTKYLENLPKNIIMAADVGLGKTIMALEHARRHNDRLNIVVIAPASKVRTGDWQREIQNFFGEDEPLHEVISYEMFVKKWKSLIFANTTLIIDESHMACNATTKRAKAILLAARLAHQWIMLSATPLPNGWRSAETYSILTGLAKNKTDFVSRYVIIDRSRGFPLILGYRDKDKLEAWWSTIAKPLVRTGDLILPSQNISVTPKLEGKLWQTYKRAKEQRLLLVGSEYEMLDSPSKLFVTLRQIPNPVRVDALQSIVESTDEHIVVFYNFNSERDAMLEMLSKSFKGRKIYEQSGHKSDLPSRDKWSTLKSCVTLVQYQSGSQAIELTYASVTVYLSPCTSYANYEQSKGRTRRNGQLKKVLFYHIAAEGSLDRHIWGILKQKKDFSTAMINKLLDM